MRRLTVVAAALTLVAACGGSSSSDTSEVAATLTTTTSSSAPPTTAQPSTTLTSTTTTTFAAAAELDEPDEAVDLVARARAQATVLRVLAEAGGDSGSAVEALMNVIDDDQLDTLLVMDLSRLDSYASTLEQAFHPDEGDVLPDYPSDAGRVIGVFAAIEACSSMSTDAPMEEAVRRIFAVYNSTMVSIERPEAILAGGVIIGAAVFLCPDLSPDGDDIGELIHDGLDAIVDSGYIVLPPNDDS